MISSAGGPVPFPPSADTEGYGRPVTASLLLSLDTVDEADTRTAADAILSLWPRHDHEERELAAALRANAGHLPSKRGGKWHPTTVTRLFSPEAREKACQQSARARAERKEQQRRERAARLLCQR
ncbi:MULTISPECIES: hypothetical protein [unclassified Streptomyces]|uniref:hypothetical protein n=1 Tax=unclassified Streptomyces TaxID=2593676 RepID=UPI00093D0972|nr:hypothetical protein [Streptomyces sp. CB01883]OKJ80703.1 hypothetical protein AMK32_23265 [Streptomyces sp. CB01883]